MGLGVLKVLGNMLSLLILLLPFMYIHWCFTLVMIQSKTGISIPILFYIHNNFQCTTVIISSTTNNFVSNKVWSKFSVVVYQEHNYYQWKCMFEIRDTWWNHGKSRNHGKYHLSTAYFILLCVISNQAVNL